MANHRKQDINYDNVLSVRAANGALQRTFDADVVQSMRYMACLLYTSPSPRDRQKSRMPSSA